MKYKALVGIFVIIFGFLVLSCTREEENLFDESAALRLNSSITEASALLRSADNGWVMEYFPNPESAGYTFLVKFSSTKDATMATVNQYVPSYKEASGYWRIINDMGPVITFDTYIDVFHIFADPIDPSSGSADGVGLGGDYEFLILSKTTDQIKLRGKKHGAVSLLRKLPAGQLWTDYFTALNTMNSSLFGRFPSDLLLKVDDKDVYTLSGGSSHIFKLVAEGGNAIDDARNVPFIITDYGIRLIDSLVIGKSSVQKFKLSDDKNALVGIDTDLNVKIASFLPVDLFQKIINYPKYMLFANTSDKMSQKTMESLSVMTNSLAASGRKLDQIGFVNNKTYGVSLAILSSKGTNKVEGFLNYSVTNAADGGVTLKFNGFTGNFDKSGQNYYTSFAASDFVGFLEDTYSLQYLEPALMATTIKFTSKSDSSKWFVLTLK